MGLGGSGFRVLGVTPSCKNHKTVLSSSKYLYKRGMYPNLNY